MRFGIALITIGGIFLLNNLGYFDNVNFSLIWPSLLMIAGILLIVKPTYQCLTCGRRGWTHSATCRACEKACRDGSVFGAEQGDTLKK